LVDPDDSGTRPLFGDGASATLLVPDDSSELTISTGSDGGGAQHIELDKGVLKMDGMEVFMFGIRKVPKLLTAFLASIDKQVQDFDYLVLHQANQLMIDRIGKKLGSAPDQVIKSLSQYGNTSGASIPLAITHQLSADREVPIRLLLCGFGAGLAWGMVSCMLDGETLLSHELYNNDEVC
jgi:3-oxoacyl-[acyl-carrier-protein] synthase-3